MLIDDDYGNVPGDAGRLKPLAWGLMPEEWKALLTEMGEKPFRFRQIWDWLYVRRVTSFDEMTNLPAATRAKLAEKTDLSPWQTDTVEESDDGVRKLLLECRDGERIEAVIIPSRDRATLCVSTQAGCGFGCAFCATGTCGLSRDLETGEIVGQLMAAMRYSEKRITNIVYMGMGEPFANYDKVLKSVRIINAQDGIAIGARRITLSTCGVIPGIERLSEEGLQVELSISLHAPNDELRNRIMPVNKRWGIEELINACHLYTEKTGRIITFEYTLVAGLNDKPENARELIGLVKRAGGRVNLIPLSHVEHFDGTAPSPETCASFAKRIERAGVNVTLRRSKGNGASAACGQLKLKMKEKISKVLPTLLISALIITNVLILSGCKSGPAGYCSPLPDLKQLLLKADTEDTQHPLEYTVIESKNLFPGIDYSALDIIKPRMMKAFLMRVDLDTPALHFTGTGRAEHWGEPMPDITNRVVTINTKCQRTRDFLLDQRKPVSEGGMGRDMVIAFNSVPWDPWESPFNHKYGHVYAPMISDGINVSERGWGNGALFVVWNDGSACVTNSVSETSAENASLVHRGFNIIMKDGKCLANEKDHALAPRTAFGVSSDGKTVYILAVDGRQKNRSLGADMHDLSAILKKAGASSAMNMDGGGSTSMVYWDDATQKDILCNRHGDTDYTRKVGASIGVYFSEPR